ncbi:transcription factor LHW-like [Silene latifolia]|uniref:transcription factor LHW-like n=1 Tax=Silene latifolia TaxID=37657 RepID=UPI003D77C5C5
MAVLGSGYEQGSSWAVEVGGHMKICLILVENLNMNGQMLIEMLCDDCDHFLEISDSIRSLDLTILKGSTDSHGDKTWMRFVVEVISSSVNRIMIAMKYYFVQQNCSDMDMCVIGQNYVSKMSGSDISSRVTKKGSMPIGNFVNSSQIRILFTASYFASLYNSVTQVAL